MNVQEKLDQLAEFHSQKDGIEFQKKSLLNEVKVPEEIIQVMNNGNKRTQEFESNQRHAMTLINEEAEKALKNIVIPEEIRAALAEIDNRRKLVEDLRNARQDEIRKSIADKRNEIYAETQAQTAKVYADIEQRKRDIEAEFSGKSDDVDKNIAALEAEIKAETKARGETIKGKYFMAVYVKGRTSWNNDMLDGMISLVPQLEKARKVGEPTITLRHI